MGRSLPSRLLHAISLGALFFAIAWTVHARPPAAQSAELEILAPPEPVVSWTKCDERDIADAGLRVLHDASGDVVAFASETTSRVMRGPSLAKLSRSCAIAMHSAFSADPAEHRDQTWIAATWTDDGVNIMGIGHDEYHAELHPSRCRGTTPRQCRYGVLVFLRSRDSGRTFERVNTRPLAAPPIRQAPDLGKDTGFFQPSNIFSHDGAQYVFVRTSGGGSQPPATCLLRSSTPLDPDSWRIYGRSGFMRQRFDPYRDDPATYRPCVQIERLNGMVWSVVTHQPSGKLLALLTVIEPGTRRIRLAISVGTDPLSWSKPKWIEADFFAPERYCDKEYAYWYPSLIDPRSPARNFDVTGDSPSLYFGRAEISNCRMSMRRDLSAAPVHLKVE